MHHRVDPTLPKLCYICWRPKDPETGQPYGDVVLATERDSYSSGLCRECEPDEYARLGLSAPGRLSDVSTMS